MGEQNGLPGTMVTGAARGIGRAIAIRLAARGGIVFIADSDYEAAVRAADEMKREGHVGHAVELDVTDVSKIWDVVSEIDEQTPLGTVVNNAGVSWTSHCWM